MQRSLYRYTGKQIWNSTKENKLLNSRRHASALILIVDDVPSNVLVLREAVRGMGDVHFANSGAAALEFTRKTIPDVILLDIEMPGMDGYAVCQAIKSDTRLQDVAIIFVTSHDKDLHEVQALNIGGVDYLQKPLNVPVARARIHTHLALRTKSRELASAQHDLVDVVQNLPAFIANWSTDLTNYWSNDVSGAWFGIPAVNMPGKHMREVLGDTNFHAIEDHLSEGLRGNDASFDLAFLRHNGTTVHGQVSLVTRSSAGPEVGFLLLITDITLRKQAELALHDEKERLRITLNSIGDAVIATDQHGIVTFLNPIAETMTGWLANEAIGEAIEWVMPLRDNSDGHTMQNPVRLALREKRTVGMALNCALQRRDGRLFDVEDSAAPILDQAGTTTGAIIVFHDVSEAHAMAIKMTHLANHDALTNLPNRLLLRDRTEQALQQARRNDDYVAMLMLDLDHFKNINDAVGHSIGDQLLQEVAQRLKTALRVCDTVSRQGGDEFIILLPDLSSLEHLGVLAGRLLQIASQPYLLGQERFDLSVSIGISIFPDDSEDLEALYRHADAAMYRSKHGGRNRYSFFSADVEASLQARQVLERQLRLAVEQQHFEVHYQLKVDAVNCDIVGAEALVRWRRADGQLTSPADFIPLAEETGLIVGLGQFVLRQACLDARAWHVAGYPVRVAVNVSAVQIQEPSFISMVQQVLQDTGIDPELLELEITEGVLAKDVDDAMRTISTLKGLGLSIAIDDFGTGYSSLAYLQQFPLDVLKIDQSFVRDMEINKSSKAIISAIISMAHGLGLTLVAEGVETETQAQALLVQGCSVMQGFLFGRAVPADDFFTLLRQGKP